MIVDGNLEEAKTFDMTGQKEETQQEEETESEQSGTKVGVVNFMIYCLRPLEEETTQINKAIARG